MEGTKCFWASTCPYYESTSSCGTERIKCVNTDCPHYTLSKEEEEQEEDGK